MGKLSGAMYAILVSLPARRQAVLALVMACLTTLRGHYVSAVTGAILLGAMVLAMKSTAFGIENGVKALPPPVTTNRQAESTSPAPGATYESPLSRPWHFYYILHSQEQKERVREAVLSDRRSGHFLEGPHSERATYFFAVASTEAEYAALVLVVDNAIRGAEHAGTRVRIIDLRFAQ